MAFTERGLQAKKLTTAFSTFTDELSISRSITSRCLVAK